MSSAACVGCAPLEEGGFSTRHGGLEGHGLWVGARWYQPQTDRKNKRPFTPSPRPRAPQRPRRRPRLTQSYYVPPGAPRQPHRRAPEQV